MKHWTQFLPEGRRIYRDEISDLVSMTKQLEKAEMQVCSLQNKIKLAEFNLYVEVEKQYSAEEINQAYQEYMESEKEQKS